MSAIQHATQVGQVYGGAPDSIIHFQWKTGMVIALYSPTQKIGFVGNFDSNKLQTLKSNEFIARFNPEKSPHTIEVKLLGSAEDILMCKTLFADSQFRIVGEKETTPSPKTELFYYSSGNRIRLSKQSARTRVMIVDDSSTVRTLLKKIFSDDPTIEVVAEIGDPLLVEAAVKELKPDVITLDIHMPSMDGVTLLKRIAPKFAVPTVMITSISMQEGPLVLEALENGAVDYIQKPSLEELDVVAPQIVERIKSAALSKVQSNAPRTVDPAPSRTANLSFDPQALVLIGSSTGGTEALRTILTRMPASIPPIVIVQHIPPVFSLAFANRLNQLCPFEVKEAADGDAIQPGRVLIAPGGFQMALKRRGTGLVVEIKDAGPVNRHKPSVDFLFESLPAESAKTTVGVILTGMGADGAKGLLKLRQMGAKTITQNEASCVVYGMPKEAVRLGASQEEVPLDQMTRSILNRCISRKVGAA